VDEAEILASSVLQYQIYTTVWYQNSFGFQQAPDLDHGFQNAARWQSVLKFSFVSRVGVDLTLLYTLWSLIGGLSWKLLRFPNWLSLYF
jgi:hypothetical protein